MEKPINSLSMLRQALKIKIYNERKVFGHPCCPICQEPFIMQDPSMHEVFVPRSVVRGCSEEVQNVIFVPQNVVLVHEGECHLYAQHYFDGKVACAMQILQYEGEDSILEWMDDIDSMMRTLDNQKRIILQEAIARNGETNGSVI